MYQRLSEEIPDVKIYDFIPEDAVPPYINFNLFTTKPADVKNINILDTTINIEVWSEQKGSKELNEIMNLIIEAMSVKINLREYGFNVILCQLDFCESFREVDIDGRKGVLTYLFKIQNLRSE